MREPFQCDLSREELREMALFLEQIHPSHLDNYWEWNNQQNDFEWEEPQTPTPMTEILSIQHEPTDRKIDISGASQPNQSKDTNKTDIASLHNVQTNLTMNILRQRNCKFTRQSNATTIKKKQKKLRRNTKINDQIDLATNARKRICIEAQTRWLLDDELDDT